ncbi:MAG: hypothetical protein ACF8GE_04410 [Phycisphaerales bacterium JB043]
MITRTLTLALASLAISFAALPIGAQPEQDRQNTPRLRQALQQRLDRLRQQEARLEDAITQLDNGADPEGIRQLLAPERQGETRAFDRGGRDGRQRPDAPGRIDDQSRPRPTQDEIIDVLRDLDPDVAQRLDGALENNPRRAEERLRRMEPRLAELAHLKKNNPDAYDARITMHKANRAVMHASRQLLHAQQQDAPEERVEQLRGALLDAISRRVDAEISEREQMLVSVSSRLDSMRQRVDTMRANRNQLVVEHMDKALERIAQGHLPRDASRPDDRPPPRR